MATLTAVLICALIGYGVWATKTGGRIPKAYRDRPCQGEVWLRAFPNATKQEIRDYLGLFVSAFAFNDNQKLLFTPEDQIMHIYRALYPSRWTPDALEVETLAKDLLSKYELSLQSVWHEAITLGQLFNHVLTQSKMQIDT